MTNQFRYQFRRLSAKQQASMIEEFMEHLDFMLQECREFSCEARHGVHDDARTFLRTLPPSASPN